MAETDTAAGSGPHRSNAPAVPLAGGGGGGGAGRKIGVPGPPPWMIWMDAAAFGGASDATSCAAAAAVAAAMPPPPPKREVVVPGKVHGEPARMRGRARAPLARALVAGETWRKISMSSGTRGPARSSQRRMVSAEAVGEVTRRI